MDYLRIARTVQQAGQIAVTPKPVNIDVVGAIGGTLDPMGMRRDLSPQELELLHYHCHEWKTTTKRIRDEVWRRELIVEPAFGLKCMECGFETDKKIVKACPACNAPRDAMRVPDERQRNLLEAKMQSVNREDQSLVELGIMIEDDVNKHDNGFLVYRYNYDLDERGIIVHSTLDEIRRVDPRIMYRVTDPETGRVGGKYFICLTCRSQPDYKPETTRSPCTGCGDVTYDAWYVEMRNPNAKTDVVPDGRFYLPNEVRHVFWHYPTPFGGTSPGVALHKKLITLICMDRWRQQGFDPNVEKRPEKILVFFGGNGDSISKWLAEDGERRRRNPYVMASLHLPMTGLGAENKPDVRVVDIGEELVKGNSQEIRDDILESLRREYGVSSIQSGQTEQSGGLNNEGLQIRVTSQTAERDQRHHQKWIDYWTACLAVTDWRVAFPPPLEEDDARQTGAIASKLDLGEKAVTLGLKARWEDGEIIISDGDIQAPDPFGLGLAGGADDQGPGEDPDIPPDSSPFPGEAPQIDEAEVAYQNEAGLPENASVDVVPEEERDQRIAKAAQGAAYAANLAGAIPKSIKDRLSGAGGEKLIKSLIHGEAFDGLSKHRSAALRKELISVMKTAEWDIQTLIDRIQPIYQRAGFSQREALARAQNVARTEVHAIVSELNLQRYREEEANTGEKGRYRVVVADQPNRTTKLSYWIRSQVGPNGKPLDELLKIQDRGIELAKKGAFMPGGEHERLKGKAIKLPAYFRRRGFTTHFGDRDRVVEAVR